MQQRVALAVAPARNDDLKQSRVLILNGIEHRFGQLHVFQAGAQHALRRAAQLAELEKRDQSREEKQKAQRQKSQPDFFPNTHVFHTPEFLRKYKCRHFTAFSPSLTRETSHPSPLPHPKRAILPERSYSPGRSRTERAP